jgi:hypothetical protein
MRVTILHLTLKKRYIGVESLFHCFGVSHDCTTFTSAWYEHRANMTRIAAASRQAMVLGIGRLIWIVYMVSPLSVG